MYVRMYVWIHATDSFATYGAIYTVSQLLKWTQNSNPSQCSITQQKYMSFQPQ